MLALLAKKLGAPKGAGRIKMSWWPAGLANDLAWLARLIWMSEGIETLIHT